MIHLIARECHIPVESLPDELDGPVATRGQVVFDFAGDAFDEIARYYTNLEWWVSDVGLNMAIVAPSIAEHVPTFDELMGHRKRRKRRRVDPVVQQIKTRVKKLRAERRSYEDICGRLGDSARPPRAVWKDLTWPNAYRQHTKAVTKWLSEACQDLR
jgi:hypothetical protein